MFKKFAVALVIAALIAGASFKYIEAQQITLAQLVDLFISLGIIAPDKAAQARAAVASATGSTSSSSGGSSSSSTSTAALILSTDPANFPAVDVVAAGGANNNESNKLPLLAFDVQTKDDGVQITSLTATISSNGSAETPAAYLYDGSILLQTAPVNGAGVVRFDLFNYSISPNTTKVLTIKADIRSAVVSPTTFSVSVVPSGLSVQARAGRSVTVSGSAVGNTMTIRNVGPLFTLLNKSISTQGSSTTVAAFSVQVQALGGDITLGTQNSSNPMFRFKAFNASGNPLQGNLTSAFAIPSSGVSLSGNASGMFTLQQNNTVSINPTATFTGNGTSGVALAIDAIGWSAGGVSNYSTFMSGDLAWRTSVLSGAGSGTSSTGTPLIAISAPKGGEVYRTSSIIPVSFSSSGISDSSGPLNLYLVFIGSGYESSLAHIYGIPKNVPNALINFDIARQKDFTDDIPAGLFRIEICDGSRNSSSPRSYCVKGETIKLITSGSLNQFLYHSADLNRDYKIDESELSYFLNLYNYRTGTVRTGEYHSESAPSENGPAYFVGPGSHISYFVHSADIDKNWQISLTELLRVIELKNATGGYKIQAGTEDGFAPINISASPAASVAPVTSTSAIPAVSAPVVPAVSTTSTCSDSDNGINLYVAGVTDGRVGGVGPYIVDTAVDANGGQCSGDSCTNVIEGYCSNGKVIRYVYACPTSYSVDGACAQKPAPVVRPAFVPPGSGLQTVPETASSNTVYHSADTNHDGKIDSGELTRVQTLYEYHSGTARTGEYHISSGTVDGYDFGPGDQSGTLHSADTDKDWKFSLGELLRVIELKNATGGYKAQDGTEDGFAPISMLQSATWANSASAYISLGQVLKLFNALR